MATTSAPNPASSKSSENATLAVSGLVIVFALISVALRFYTRKFTHVGLGADDWLTLAAVIATIGTIALLTWCNRINPNGVRITETAHHGHIFTAAEVLYLELSYAISILYFAIAGATKLGILLMYHRIFAVSTAFRYRLFLSIASVIGWWIGCTVAALMYCIPFNWDWNNPDQRRQCFNYNIFWMASGACEILLDVLILMLPVSVIMRMCLSTQRKITISMIFLLGGFAIITGLIRVILSYRHGSSFPSYSNTQVWATLHAGLSIVCASLPVLRPLTRRISRSPFITNAPNIFFIRKLSRKPNSTYPETASEPSTFREASRRNHSTDSLRGNK